MTGASKRAPAVPKEAAAGPAALVEAGVWAAAGLAPLVWTTHVMAEYTLPKLLAMNLGAFLCALGLAWAGLRRAPWVRPTSLEAPLAALAAALAASTWFSRDWRISLAGRYNSYANGLWELAAHAAMFYCAFLALDSRARRRVISMCVATGLLVCAYALLQAAGKEPFLRPERLLEARSIASLGSPVDLGAYLAMILPLVVARIAYRRSRVWDWTAAAVIGGALYSTGSRGSWIAAMGACALSWWLVRRSSPDARLLSGRGKIISAILLLFLVGALGRRASMRVSAKSDSGRVEGWKTAWSVFLGHPWLGTGPDTFEQAFRQSRGEGFIRAVDWRHIHAYAHNDVLQALATTGLLGTAAYAWLLWALFLAGRRACRRAGGDVAAGCSGMLLAWFINVKLNPVALEVLLQTALGAAIVCASAHEEAPPGSVAGRVPRSAAFFLLALASASLCRTVALLRADYEVKEAHRIIDVNPRQSGLAHFNRALVLDICETAYHVEMANHIGDLLSAAPDADTRGKLITAERALGLKSVQCHPNDVNAHYTAGYAAAQAARFGDGGKLAEAESELARAMELDPYFVPLIEFRMRVAKARGDARLAEDLAARIRYLESIVDRTPGRG